MRHASLALCACLAIWSSNALAQNAPPPKNEIRINTNISMSQRVSAAAGDALSQQQTAARKAIYEITGQECKLLLATIASECRLEFLNVNSNTQNQFYRADVPSVVLATSSNASFQVRLKQ